MTRDNRLLFAPLALIVFIAGILILPALIPGYDSIRQTVSEIGEMDSPMRWPFAAMLLAVAICMFAFALGLRAASIQARHNTLSAWLAAWMGAAAAALGWFAFPHPLHNVFGLSELIGYQAPLAFALTWRNDPRADSIVRFSWLMYVLLSISLAANLTAIVRTGEIWNDIRPFYGLVQRSLFLCFFAWSTGAGWMLWKSSGSARPAFAQ
ncbi:MAG: DUF998 domain-containing protein [Proteobacteria bacterium]|nr:DUF998 domain-containing protein [Pseudomonadota bacterium]